MTLIASGALGCAAESTGTSTPGPVASMSIVSGDVQSATVATQLPQPLVALATDASGTAIGGQVVNFVVVSGGGHVFAGAAQSNASGIVQERWTLGTVADTQRLEVRAVDATTGAARTFAVFRAVATADAAAQITLFAGGNQSAVTGAAVTTAPSVRVNDQYGNPVPGVAVTFAVQSGGGSITGATATTNSAGVAQVGSWILGPSPGDNQLTASIGGASTIIAAQGLAPQPATIEKVSGDAQSAPGVAGTSFPAPLVVRVRLNNGQLGANVSVSFAGSGNGGIGADGRSGRTDANGLTSVAWPAGPTPIPYTETVVASVSGLTQTVAFAETHTPVYGTIKSTYESPPGGTFAVAGRVTLNSANGGFYIQDATGGIEIRPNAPLSVVAGDSVAARGVLSYQSPLHERWIAGYAYVIGGTRVPVVPRILAGGAEFAGTTFTDQLVTARGVLVDSARTSHQGTVGQYLDYYGKGPGGEDILLRVGIAGLVAGQRYDFTGIFAYAYPGPQAMELLVASMVPSSP